MGRPLCTGAASRHHRRNRDTKGWARRHGCEERIPVAEERLNVGKREVNEGRVRVRSYVVEPPVQEQVNLRQEHVSVERRPVDRPVTEKENLFQERTIEATEKGEQAVVSKEARGHCHGNIAGSATWRSRAPRSGSCRGVLPLLSGVCPKQAQSAAGEQVALDREGVVNRGMHAEEAL